MKDSEQTEEELKRKEEERKAKQEEEERRRREEEESRLPPEERDLVEKKKQADSKKNEGNAAYKSKDFARALELYEEAINLNPNELAYYTNKAAVYFEQKNY